MNRFLVSLLALLGVVWGGAGWAAAPDYFPKVGEVMSAEVVRIKDGDTLAVLVSTANGPREVPVRLAEIDAPEKAQAFGAVSKEKLSELVGRKVVEVRVTDHDLKWGAGRERIVGKVFVAGGDVNLWMVRNGYAWAYRQYMRDAGIGAAEDAARSESRGLWVDKAPVAPWMFRRKE